MRGVGAGKAAAYFMLFLALKVPGRQALAVGDSFIVMRDGEMHPVGGGVQNLGLLAQGGETVVGEEQGRGWVGPDGRGEENL